MLAERLSRIVLDSQYAEVTELCLYNAVLTGMSHDGTKFAYDNPLVSSPQQLSRREDWFRCVCCPPNVTRLLGSLGGYLWFYDAIFPEKQPAEKSAATTTAEDAPRNEVQVTVHQYASVTLTVPFSDGRTAVQVRQASDFPWEGTTRFGVRIADGVDVTLRLRLPDWAADSWTLEPAPPQRLVRKGYLVLPPAYMAAHCDLVLSTPMRPRLVAPHPYTNQHVAALARGPLVYCVEDIDNDWVTDHFKDVVISTDLAAGAVEERRVRDEGTGEDYLRLTLKGAAFHRPPGRPAPASVIKVYGGKGGGVGGAQVADTLIPELHFVPYYFRANRGGSGQMRVGLRQA